MARNTGNSFQADIYNPNSWQVNPYLAYDMGGSGDYTYPTYDAAVAGANYKQGAAAKAKQVRSNWFAQAGAPWGSDGFGGSGGGLGNATHPAVTSFQQELYPVPGTEALHQKLKGLADFGTDIGGAVQDYTDFYNANKDKAQNWLDQEGNAISNVFTGLPGQLKANREEGLAARQAEQARARGVYGTAKSDFMTRFDAISQGTRKGLSDILGKYGSDARNELAQEATSTNLAYRRRKEIEDAAGRSNAASAIGAQITASQNAPMGFLGRRVQAGLDQITGNRASDRIKDQIAQEASNRAANRALTNFLANAGRGDLLTLANLDASGLNKGTDIGLEGARWDVGEGSRMLSDYTTGMSADQLAAAGLQGSLVGRRGAAFAGALQTARAPFDFRQGAVGSAMDIAGKYGSDITGPLGNLVTFNPYLFEQAQAEQAANRSSAERTAALRAMGGGGGGGYYGNPYAGYGDQAGQTSGGQGGPKFPSPYGLPYGPTRQSVPDYTRFYDDGSGAYNSYGLDRYFPFSV